jgi:hypothetical protein
MKSVTSIRCYFEVIGGGFDPAIVPEALGIEPSTMWRVGDTTRKSGRPYKRDGWALHSNEVESLDVEEIALPILIRLQPVAASLRELCARFNLEAILSCAVYVVDGQMAAISLGRDTVQMLCALGAALDVDVLDLGASVRSSSA